MRRLSCSGITFAFAALGAISSHTHAAQIVAPCLNLSPATLFASDDIPQNQPTSPAQSYFENTYGLTGDWFGARKTLDDQHICFGGYIILDISKVLNGGRSTSDWSFLYLLDLHVAIDTEPTLHWKGGTFFIDFESHDQSENNDTIVGDIQGYDNITAPRFVQFNQLWYKQAFGGFARIKIGKIDANTDAACLDADANDAFSLIEHGLGFINSAAAYTPTMYPMATYPDPPPGIQIFITPGNDAGQGYYLAGGAFYVNRNQNLLLFTGNPERVEHSIGGSFLIGELGARWEATRQDMKLPGHAAIGGWYQTGRFKTFDNGDLVTGSGGAYAFLDQTLWKKKSLDIGAFILAGLSTDTNPIDQNLAFGIEATGLIPSRPNDALGLFTTWGHIPAQPAASHTFEWATEAFYRIQITPWASLKPDLQYIINPAGQFSDAIVTTLRLEIDF